MLCSSQHKGRNYFQADGAKLKENKLNVNSTSDTFQRKYENFD